MNILTITLALLASTGPGADVSPLQWSERISALADADACTIFSSEADYRKKLDVLKVGLVPGAARGVPQIPEVAWKSGVRALVFAHGTAGKTEYRFQGVERATGTFFFVPIASSKFPQSEVIVVTLPQEVSVSAPACSDASPDWVQKNGGRSKSYSSAPDGTAHDSFVVVPGGRSGSRSTQP
jgi:hypothetical protein